MPTEQSKSKPSKETIQKTIELNKKSKKDLMAAERYKSTVAQSEILTKSIQNLDSLNLTPEQRLKYKKLLPKYLEQINKGLADYRSNK